MTARLIAESLLVRRVGAPAYEVFGEANCIDRWDEFDVSPQPGTTEADSLRKACITCPALEACREQIKETDALYGAYGFAAGMSAADRERGLTPKQVEWFAQIRPFYYMGMTDGQMADALGVKAATISRYRNDMGLRPNGERRGGARGRSKIARIR